MPIPGIGTGEMRRSNYNAGYHDLNANHVPGTLPNALYSGMLNYDNDLLSKVILSPLCHR